ncbi:MAG: methyltransferase [Bacteroidota bacterium]|nr:methyltransferase [Bacteroidota bacterium]
MDIFQWGDIQVMQNSDVLKVGTDAILLGSWIQPSILSPLRILDVGCGTGVLSLMMAQTFPNAIIEAIDIQPAAAGLASENFKKSNWNQRLTAKISDVMMMEKSTPSYDLIIINPPYYLMDNIPSQSISNRIAKHSVYTYADWMKALDKQLSSTGEIAMIIPYENAFAWIKAANAFGTFVRNRLDVFSFSDDDNPKRTLLKFGKKLLSPEQYSLVMYDRRDEHTSVYRQFLSLKKK